MEVWLLFDKEGRQLITKAVSFYPQGPASPFVFETTCWIHIIKATFKLGFTFTVCVVHDNIISDWNFGIWLVPTMLIMLRGGEREW